MDGQSSSGDTLQGVVLSRRQFLLASAGVGVLGALAACSAPASVSTQQQPTGATRSVLRIGHEDEVMSNIDPHQWQGRYVNYLENIYEPLAYPYQDTFEIRPVLAESIDISEDGTTYTFTLRPDVQFHDGSILDSEAVKRSFERHMAIGLAAGQDQLNQFVTSISTPDPLTVVFEVIPGGVPFLAVQTAVLILSAQALEENKTDQDPWANEFFALNAVGTGPYRLTELRPKDVLRIGRFDEYWGGWEGDHIDEAVWMQIPEGATQALMLERGELDVSYIVPLESVAGMAANPDLQVLQGRGNYTFYLRMNASNGPLADKTLRQAFAHAFDYDAFLTARTDYLTPDGPVASQLLGGWRPENLPTYDIELAKQLYAEAGYGPDNPLRIEQAIVVGADYQRVAAEIMQQGLQQLGVEYTIAPNQFAPVYQGLLRLLREGDESGYVDMFTFRAPSNVPDAVSQLVPYKEGADFNYMGYYNERVEELTNQALLTPDADERNELYKEAISLIVDDVPDIWLGVENRTIVMNAAVKGFYQHPLWWPALRIYPMYLEQ